jgi:hypothetical protein
MTEELGGPNVVLDLLWLICTPTTDNQPCLADLRCKTTIIR